MAQVHVLTGSERRRRFSLEQKRTMVAAAFAPGAVVADVARRADVCSSLIYRWRRELRAASHGFAEVLLAPGVAGGGEGRGDPDGLPALRPGDAARPGTGDASAAAAIEVEFFGSSRLRIPASTPPALAAAVIAAPMTPVPGGVRVWLAVGRTDMRRGMNGLALQVQEALKRDPHAGDLYVFRGRRGDLIKILWHDGLGMSLYAKRLERGRFLWPSPADGIVSITPAQLAYLLDGIEMALARPLRAGGTRSTPSGRSGPVDVGMR